MSDNTNGATQTLSSSPSMDENRDFEQSSVSQCLHYVDEFKKGAMSKGEALLEIQSILQGAVSESHTLTQLDFKSGFNHYVELLDHVNSADGAQPRRDDRSPAPSSQRESRHDGDDDRSDSIAKEKELRKRLHRRVRSEEAESDESGDEDEFVLRAKRRKLTAERIQYFPWLQPASYRHSSSRRAEQLTLECYEEWSDDVKYYRGQVTSTPGCPSFPLSQWSLLLEGRAPDLEKVLSGHYSTTIDPKQTQSLGKGFEITLSQPTTTHKVKTFIMPWKEDELRGYKRYLSGFFVDVHYSLHSRIIDFDKACRLKIEGQKYLRFDSINEFRRLEITHLSSLGMVAYSELQQLSGSSLKFIFS